jgi:hypothetical protein
VTRDGRGIDIQQQKAAGEVTAAVELVVGRALSERSLLLGRCLNRRHSMMLGHACTGRLPAGAAMLRHAAQRMVCKL